jgi:hypothetical protein
VSKCGICGQELDVPGNIGTADCGGDCLRCMAEAGDPHCIQTMRDHKLPFRDDGRPAYEEPM